jgi:hypothetical protein
MLGDSQAAQRVEPIVRRSTHKLGTLRSPVMCMIPRFEGMIESTGDAGLEVACLTRAKVMREKNMSLCNLTHQQV